MALGDTLVCSVSIDCDTSQLDQAIAKAKELEQIMLRLQGVGLDPANLEKSVAAMEQIRRRAIALDGSIPE